MTRRRKPIWRTVRRARRALHFTERTLGDIDAADRGVLHKRLIRRGLLRRLLRPTNRW